MTKQLEALIAEIKAAAENATQGEWCTDSTYGVIADAGLNGNYYVASCSGPESRPNTRFIAKANPENILSLIAALEQSQQQKDQLSHHLHCAHGFIEHTEAFGHEASSGILCCGDARWNIDASKSVLAGTVDARPLAVKLPKRSVGEVMHMSGFSRDYAEGWCAGNDNAIHEIRAAGGTVKGE